MKKKQLLVISFCTYSRVVQRSEFRIRRPQTDVYNFCTRAKLNLRYKTDFMLKIKYYLHRAKVHKYFQDKKDLIALVKGGNEHLVIEFDFSQNYPLPFLSSNEQYYKRLLSVFLFNVHCHNNGRSRLYHFLETESRKGASSVVFSNLRCDKQRLFSLKQHTSRYTPTPVEDKIRIS